MRTAPLCLPNVPKYCLADNMHKTRLCGYVYDLSIDYDITDVAIFVYS